MGLGRLAAALCASSVLGGCSLITDSFLTNEFSGDQYPIQVEVTSGAVVVGLRQAGKDDRTAVLDVLSPLTLVDPGPTAATSISTADVLVMGATGPGGTLDRPRAQLSGALLLSLHPCQTDACVVGPETAPRPFDAIIGADALAGDAVRLRLGDQQVFVLPDVAGDEHQRSLACDAVFPSPYRGGGTLVIAGTERTFGGRRVAIQACLGANPQTSRPQGKRGADALLVASTAIAQTILGVSAYQRYREAHDLTDPADTPPTLESLPTITVNLPSGPITGRLGTLDSLALVATSSASPRAPCRQVYGSHILLQRNCTTEDADCPCENGDLFCAVPAVVELAAPTSLQVVIVGDDDPTLQALRAELRPDQAEVDGILGTLAMRTAEFDIDYPHDRALARCTSADPTSGCKLRPGLTYEADREQIQACFPIGPTGPVL